jgi:NAD(P)-dependent dehydrogenase (short-subunit alcohol dehydrogenase family)
MTSNVLNTDLTGKVAVVTGAGGVLCSVLAKVLARAGAKVALVNRTYENAVKVEREILAEGGIARSYACDVTNRETCFAVADQVLTDLGPCDILLNGAGGNNPRATTDKEYYEPGDLDADTKSFFDLDQAGVEAVFNLNFIGTLLTTQAFARHMVGREGCCILNISSMNAYTPLTKIPAYSGAKAAVTNFTQWLAVHFSKVGIRVNAIAPGFFATRQNASLLYNPDGTPTNRTAKILAATPMGRFGNAEKELSGAVLFLLNNEAAGFITGVTIPIDGGFSAYSGV